MTDAQHYDAIVVGTGSYEELEPYYTQAEHLYLVHGRHGEDPTEGPTSAQYAYPPVQHEPRIQQLLHLPLDEKNDIAGPNHLRHEPQGMLGHLGMHEHPLLSWSIYPPKGMPIGATAHQAGTVRFGRDPAASALDVGCTAIANAPRVGDRIADRLR
ncbi:hypothetical protein ACFWD7_05370 [Streptomyces mirabilis]|uniref:hypothetical protein n=1 Tax=Streptomyces mirabilis TaxID=68239 RepID=UPI0021C00B87|nr:hypothetical protein [Streptomyces mirabilis]MCT9109721.1 hypothetical protein [Streptomyces mirabilis]